MHERLRAAREHAGFGKASEAAEALGVKYATYAGHENGSSGFRRDKGELYARRFKVRFEWLMLGRGPMVEGGAAPERDQDDLVQRLKEAGLYETLLSIGRQLLGQGEPAAEIPPSGEEKADPKPRKTRRVRP